MSCINYNKCLKSIVGLIDDIKYQLIPFHCSSNKHYTSGWSLFLCAWRAIQPAHVLVCNRVVKREGVKCKQW